MRGRPKEGNEGRRKIKKRRRRERGDVRGGKEGRRKEVILHTILTT